jgi:hypothetical protein
MPDTPAYAPDLLDLQVQSLRAQDALHQLPATASDEERQAARDRAGAAAVALYGHPGHLASQAGGKWAGLREAARKVIAEEDGVAGA